ncbi:IclR family transcriptional regulator [Raineyella fluvialis]|uniref:Glycerol operon regulatory protein n=1 Tax=Raineyella fluvialis TaxID=2662261 RepID=A0A5Q2FGC6_9ACTN|nr:IclR family transcriptional regulator [Raineyella fluvialis]QGF23356.1 helix-turn-helix domain-containing protein [Raineyella fluvialis]
MTETTAPTSTNSVQSIVRAFRILEEIALSERPMGISEIAENCNLPMPTAHRILRTLIAGGYAFQTPRRTYALGARLIPLSRYAGGSLGIAFRPMLAEFAAKVDESVSVAMLDQDFARYIAHVPSEHPMRLFTEVGNQVSIHASGVGKAILSQFSDAEVRTILDRAGMRAFTPTTITDPNELIAQLHEIRERGYAIDEAEHDLGVRCVAVSLDVPLHLAVSASGLPSRMTDEVVTTVVVPELNKLAERLREAIEKSNTQWGR